LDPDQRVAFVALARGEPLADVVDELELHGESEAAELVREIAVEELEDSQLTDREISAVVAQLIRASVTVALKEVERDVRSGVVTPDSGSSVIRDVKSRLHELVGPDGPTAEADLRAWLASREERPT
jgi:hypothetical protein